MTAAQLPRVRCFIQTQRDGYRVLVEVRSKQYPQYASQTVVNPGHFLSARDLEREVQKQAARLAVHIIDTRRDALLDPDECARLAPAALASAAIELHKAELRRAS